MKSRANDPDWQKAEYERVMGEEKLRRQVAAAAAEREREKSERAGPAYRKPPR